MPTSRTLLPAFLLLAASALAAADHHQTGEDAAVRAAVLDYVEGIYFGEVDRIRESVSPQLAKTGFYRPGEGEDFRETPMTYDELVELAGSWGEGRDLADAPREITVTERLDRIASARLVAAWGVDHMQLVKRDGTWQIVHVIWQGHTEETAAQARDATAAR